VTSEATTTPADARGTARSRFSVAGKVALLVGVHVVVTAGVAAVASLLLPQPVLVFTAGASAGTVLALLTVRRSLASARRTLTALSDGVRSFRDTDFSMRLAATRDDELGELVALYNEMGDALRAERHDIYQRELLLDTVLQGAPVGIILEDRNGRVVYGNRAARDLLGARARLEGRMMAEVLSGCRRELREALAAPGDALFTVGGEGEEETYRTARRVFHLNMQPNVLHLVERLTPELRRKEVEVWKRAIRVMSHELNNSLAPIRSLSHSARQAAGRPEHTALLEGILATIEERATHLAAFLEGYARFARLPQPRPEPVDWRQFLESVHAMSPFQLAAVPPAEPGWFDAVQMQQVLINLLKNAQESGSPPQEIGVSVHLTAQAESVLRVVDRGPGMDPSVMKRALLPFHSSTKQAGSGVGLALCKEIVEAHGGGLRIENRTGGGLVVTCWLPAGPASRPSVPVADAPGEEPIH
jgi:two-component system, NtrC family, nitrogen regulation sensor histidine kinase NtrY